MSNDPNPDETRIENEHVLSTYRAIQWQTINNAKNLAQLLLVTEKPGSAEALRLQSVLDALKKEEA